MNAPSRAQELTEDLERLTRRIAADKRATRLLEADKIGLQRQLDALNQIPLPEFEPWLCDCGNPRCPRTHLRA